MNRHIPSNIALHPNAPLHVGPALERLVGSPLSLSVYKENHVRAGNHYPCGGIGYTSQFPLPSKEITTVSARENLFIFSHLQQLMSKKKIIKEKKKESYHKKNDLKNLS